MPEKPKAEESKVKDEMDGSKPSENDPKRSYYYDDAHGYEDFDPHADEDEEFED